MRRGSYCIDNPSPFSSHYSSQCTPSLPSINSSPFLSLVRWQSLLWSDGRRSVIASFGWHLHSLLLWMDNATLHVSMVVSVLLTRLSAIALGQVLEELNAKKVGGFHICLLSTSLTTSKKSQWKPQVLHLTIKAKNNLIFEAHHFL